MAKLMLSTQSLLWAVPDDLPLGDAEAKAYALSKYITDYP